MVRKNILIAFNMLHEFTQKSLHSSKGAGATEAAAPTALAMRGHMGQKMPYGHAQKCPLKYGKIIIKNLKTAYS